nr:VWA domain-containing protein [Myxococcota bacterium]
MRRTWGALVALGVVIGLVGPAHAQEAWVGGSALQGRVVVGADGETWVGVWVDAPSVVAVPQARAPMAVSLVVDTSGSMAGDKIRNAQMATSSLLESLSDGDLVSIYGFSNAVTEIAPPTIVSASTRGMLMQRVSLLVAGGGTNLYGGMQVGVQRISQAPPSHPVRRIFVISDGRANVGPSDPQSLGDLAAGATEYGTQVTAIGVGYDYDPQSLNAMVVRSAGRLHHLGAPHQMASILEQELSMMARSVALSAHIEIVPAPGVIILSGATTGAVVVDGRLRFPLGSLVAGQRREVLFRVRMNTAHMGPRTLATARLVYESPTDRAPQTQTTAIRYEVTRDPRAVSAPTPRVAAMVAQHDANVAQRRAAEQMAQGQAQQAAR